MRREWSRNQAAAYPFDQTGSTAKEKRHEIDVRFPTNPQYRAARDRLLGKEIELRRQMEVVAAERRKLPHGGMLKDDVVRRAGR